MERIEEYYESLEECLLIGLPCHCGGLVKVAKTLWPDKTDSAARSLYRQCCDENNAARFNPWQLMTLIRMGRKRGYHIPMEMFSADCGYEVTQITREDKRTRLMRQLTSATTQAEKAQKKLDALDKEPMTIMRAVGE